MAGRDHFKSSFGAFTSQQRELERARASRDLRDAADAAAESATDVTDADDSADDQDAQDDQDDAVTSDATSTGAQGHDTRRGRPTWPPPFVI